MVHGPEVSSFPNGIVEDSRTTGVHIGVYVVMELYAYGDRSLIDLTVEKIAELLDFTMRQVECAIKDLDEFGWITIDKQQTTLNFKAETREVASCS